MTILQEFKEISWNNLKKLKQLLNKFSVKFVQLYWGQILIKEPQEITGSGLTAAQRASGATNGRIFDLELEFSTAQRLLEASFYNMVIIVSKMSVAQEGWSLIARLDQQLERCEAF